MSETAINIFVFSYLFLHLLCDEVVFGEIPSEGLEAARVVEGGAADEAGHARHAVDAEQARDEVDARQPRPEVYLRIMNIFLPHCNNT